MGDQYFVHPPHLTDRHLQDIVRILNLIKGRYLDKYRVCSPDAFKLRHENLEIFPGDMTCEGDVHRACIGVSEVICVAGGPVYQWSRYPFGFMSAFVGYLIDGMRKAGVKRLVYQAGRVNPFAGEDMTLFNRVLRGALARCIGIKGNEQDNDSVIDRLMQARDLDWTVTRPNYMMGQSLSKQPLISCVNKRPPFHSFILSFKDVGYWTVRVAYDESLIHTFPAPQKSLPAAI